MPAVITKSEMQQFIALCQKLETFVLHVIRATPSEQQMDIIRAIDAGDKRIAVKSGHGCFAKGHPVMLFNGFVKPVEDIEVGDALMGDDGKSSRKVLELKRGQEEMYRFTFNSCDVHTYNASHKLVLVATQTHGTQKCGNIVEVEVKDWLLWSDRKKRTHAVMKSAVSFNEGTLPIDPYALGVWLGDGNSRDSRVHLGDTKVEVEKFIGGRTLGRSNNANTIYLPIRAQLKELGLLNNKHIPTKYFFASTEQRLKLLAGLLDTDGSIAPRKSNQFEITQKRKVLAEGILRLTQSVGIHATLHEKIVNGVNYYRVHISRNVNLLSPYLKRIHLSKGAVVKTTLNFGIKKVDALGVGDYYGFVLDGNHRFLSGDFIVTRNTGKSTLLSWISLWVGVSKYDAKIPITAPSAPQLLSTLMPEIKKWRTSLPSVLQDSVDIKTDTAHFKNGNELIMRTARKESPEALQGYHATNLYFLVDEGSGVPDNIFEVVEGALTGEHNVIIMVGNPTRTSGYFYNAFHKNQDLWKTFTLNAELSSNVSKDIIELRRKQYGTDSDVYRVRVLGEFPRASSDALFSVELLEEATKRESYADDGDEIWGLDVAWYGDDKSCLAKRKGYFLRPLDTREKQSTLETASWVISEYHKAFIKPVAIFVDNNGVGAGVYDQLIQAGLPIFDGNSSRSSAEFGLANKRIEMYQRLSKKLINMKIPDDDELLGELSAVRYIISEKGLLMLEPKAETKKRLGRSPDKGDAVALTFYEDIFVSDIQDEMHSRRMEKADEHRNEGGEVGVAW